jgi:hypothetical protein
MNRIVHNLAILICLACAACAEPGARQDGAPSGTADAEVREILVTFVDRGLTRTPNAAPGLYRQRSSDYQATTWSRSISAAIARDYALETITQWPIRALGVHCVVYGVSDTQSLDELIEQLVKDSRVQAVQRMNTFYTMSSDDPYRPLQTSLSAMGIEAAHRWTTGEHVTVAIIDTGVDIAHPDLAGQVAEYADLTSHPSEFDDDIHGTAVAGIIGAVAGNGLGIEGIAPDAHLTALRACWPERPGEIAAVCNSLTLARALDTAIFMKPQVVNLSLTGPPDPLVGALVRSALRAGIVVVAAEPERPEAADFTSGIEGIIRVRAGTGQAGEGAPPSDDTQAVVAPGTDVLTTFPHGTYNFASGSSFAAAHVSGIVALLLQLKPGLTSSQTGELLGAVMRESAIKHASKATAHIDVCKAIMRLRPDVVCTSGGYSASLDRGTFQP